jgi:predicted transposase/invertase (TIGR01784 family)
MPSRYLDPKIDLAFKRVFGEQKHLLISFLNALLPLPDDAPIESLDYLSPEQVPELPGLFKNSIVDVKCRDAQGRTFIVEMQMLWSDSFTQRIVFGASQAYVKQLYAGQHYSSLQPVYALAITNQIFDHRTDNYYHHYQLVNLEATHERLEDLQFVFIELPKFKPSSSAQSITFKRMHVKWLRFLKEVGLSTDKALVADFAQDTEIQTALHLLETANLTEPELEAYHVHMDRLRIEPTVLHDARVKGLAEGLEKGVAQGKAQAMAPMVQALHASGMKAAQISQIANIPLAQVQACLSDPPPSDHQEFRP